MKKLEVLWIAPYPYESINVDGNKKPVHAAPWITSLADEIKEDVNLTIVSFSRRIEKDIFLEMSRIKFYFLRIPKPIIEFLLFFKGNLHSFKKFSESFDFSKYDIIHIHGTEHQYASGISNIDIPKVISIQGLIHEYIPFNRDFNYNYFSWRFLKKYELQEILNNKNFICRTHWDKGIIETLNKNSIIYENWELLRPDFFTDAFDFNSNKLIYIGGLTGIKGINETLKSFALLHEWNADYELIICGPGNPKLLNKLLQKHNLLYLKSSIIFEGKKNAKELVSLFSKSFCLVHPTYIDNSPNSVCEAQVSGLPVIASNVGGVSSLIEHKITGILVERFDYMDIANSIKELKENEKLYADISNASRILARKRHDKKTIRDKTLDIYNAILNQ